MATLVLIVLGVLALLVLAFLLVRAFMSPMVIIAPNVTGPLNKFLRAAPHDQSTTYARDERFEDSSVVFPFADVIISTLEFMSVIHFEHAAGLQYVGLEPQVFRLPDGTTVKRMLATTEKRDEGDIYLQRGELARDKLLYRVTEQVGKVRDILEADFGKFESSIQDTGLYIDATFTDRYGRNIALKIDQQRLGKKAIYKSMIAPASLATHEQYFPLLFLGHMSLADRNTDVSVTINGVQHELMKLPVLGANMIVFSSDTVGFYLFLTAMDRRLKVHTPEESETTIRLEQPNFEEENAEKFDPSDRVQITHTIQRNGRFSEIAQSEYAFDDHAMQLAFGPPLPSALHMKSGAAVDGKFAISADGAEGIVAGSYRMTRQGDRVMLSLQLKDAYQPVRGDKWVSAYRWESVVHLDDETPRMEARWHKKRIINDGLTKITVVD